MKKVFLFVLCFHLLIFNLYATTEQTMLDHGNAPNFLSSITSQDLEDDILYPSETPLTSPTLTNEQLLLMSNAYVALKDDLEFQEAVAAFMPVDPVTTGATLYITEKAVIGLLAVCSAIVGGLAGFAGMSDEDKEAFIKFCSDNWEYGCRAVASLPPSTVQQLAILGICISEGKTLEDIDWDYLAEAFKTDIDSLKALAVEVFNNGITLIGDAFNDIVGKLSWLLSSLISDSKIPDTYVPYATPDQDFRTFKTSEGRTIGLPGATHCFLPDYIPFEVSYRCSGISYNYGWKAYHFTIRYRFIDTNGDHGTLLLSYYKKLSSSQVLDHRIQLNESVSYDNNQAGYNLWIYKNDSSDILYQQRVYTPNYYSSKMDDTYVKPVIQGAIDFINSNFSFNVEPPTITSTHSWFSYFDTAPFPNGFIINISDSSSVPLTPISIANGYVEPDVVHYPEVIKIDPNSDIGKGDIISTPSGKHPSLNDPDTLREIINGDLPIPIRDVVYPDNPFKTSVDPIPGIDPSTPPSQTDPNPDTPSSNKSLLSTLLDWLKSLITALKQMFIELFVPSEDYFNNWFNRLRQQVAEWLGYSSYSDLLKGLQNIKAIPIQLTIVVYGKTVTIVDFSVYSAYHDALATFIRGFVYVLILLFYMNNIYRLIRAHSFTHGSESKG